MTRASPTLALLASTAIAASVAGCAVSVANELEEPRANRVVALLASNGIAAEKAADPAEPGHFRVEVGSDEASRAVDVLVEQGPPSHDAPGVLDALGTGSLVPSPQAEHERVLAGVAGDLTRSLESIDGVLSARVHIAASRPDPLALDRDVAPPTAAVLVRYRGASAPIAEADVQKLVANAVPGLTKDRVAVVYSAASPAHASIELVRLGPFSATRTTARTVRGALLAVILVNAALAAALVALWARLRRFRSTEPGKSEP